MRKFSSTEKDIFKDYPGNLDYDICKAVWTTTADIAHEHLRAGKKLLVPRIGYFQIQKYKAKKPRVDYHLTKLHGRTIRFANRHTGGRAVKLMWFRSYEGATLFWAFKGTRTVTRTLAKYIKQHGLHHFYEITPL